MNTQVRAFALSGIIHATFFAAVIVMSTMMPNKKELVIIDFSIVQKEKEGTSIPESKPSVPKTVKRKTVRETSPIPAVREQIQRDVSPPLPPLPPEKQIMAESVPAPLEDLEPVPAEESAPVEEIDEAVYAETQTGDVNEEGTEADAKAVASASSSPSEGNSGGGRIAIDYSYIRERVQGNISYPSMAKRNGWEGKVMISFIICCDGKVKDIIVQESSGNKMLDKNAIEAVKRASPFPEQPMEAKVIIPIMYRLTESG